MNAFDELPRSNQTRRHELVSRCHRLYRPAEAIKAYEQTLAQDPNHAFAMFDLGGTY